MLEIVSGTISKGDRKGETWEAIKITVGEYQKLIFPNSSQPLKISTFEFKYIKEYLENN